MRPEDYVFGIDLCRVERELFGDLGATKMPPPPSSGGGCVGTSAPAPRPPAATAVRMKGEPIVELRPTIVGHKPGNVVLELTPEAAEVLMGVLGFICGKDSGPRSQVNAIFRALSNLGVQSRRFYGEYGARISNIWIQ